MERYCKGGKKNESGVIGDVVVVGGGGWRHEFEGCMFLMKKKKRFEF